MKLLVEDPVVKRVDTTADTAATQAFNRKAKLITALEGLSKFQVDQRVLVATITVLTMFISDKYISALVKKIIGPAPIKKPWGMP